MEFILLFVIGAALGSFLNVLIDRLSTGREFVKGRSYCENCKKTLKPKDLVPLLSYLILKGKCAYCKKSIPIRLFVIELTTGILTVALYLYTLTFGHPLLSFLFLFIILYSFLGIFVADLIYGIIPDLLVGVSLIASLSYLFITQLPFVNHLLAGIGALAFFLFLFFLTKGKGMGFGDVKLSFVLGLLLGFPLIVVSLYLAFLTGAFISIILVICRKMKFFGSTIPFGPFLILSTVVALFYGDKVLSLFIARFL